MPFPTLHRPKPHIAAASPEPQPAAVSPKACRAPGAMNAMAISHTGEAHHPVPRQQPVAATRQIALCASSRLNAPTPPPRSQTTPPIERDYGRHTPQPQMRSLPSSPLWESPHMDGAHPLRSPMASPKFYPHGPRLEQPHPQPHGRTHHADHLLARDGSGILHGAGEAQSALPLSPKSPAFDIHAHHHHNHNHHNHNNNNNNHNHSYNHNHSHHHPVENFSRPRKLSIQQHSVNPAKLRLAHVPGPEDPMPGYNNGLPPTPASLHDHRRRVPSISTSRQNNAVPTTVVSPSHPPPSDILEPGAARARDGSLPPVSVSRAPFGFSRIEDSASVPTPSGSAPWSGGDDPRSSFRQQFAASAMALSTAVTKRASVLSKVSSVVSLYAANPDEPSLEDVMGMYERGFDDDEDDDDEEEEEYRDDHDHDHLDDKPGSVNSLTRRRPMTAMSEPAGYSVAAIDSFDDSDEPLPPVPVVPAAQSALDAEIRQSKMLFASLAFTSTVPALASHTMSFSQRRSSARTFDSEHSVSSDPHPSESKTVSVHISGPSISVSRSTSPGFAQLPVQHEPEDPDSRDRYGFKKESQYVTRAQYDAWNKSYEPYLARRRKKWTMYLKDSALMTDRPNRFPAPNAKTKRFVRKGIPPDWRGAAWFYYAGGPAILAKHSGLYEKLLLRKASQVDIEAIERDLHRTFPDNVRFKPSGFAADRLETTTSSERASQSSTTAGVEGGGPGPKGLEGEPPIISALRRVLLAFSVYNPKIGYCQSLNFIAGLLLLFVETEEQCFWLLNVITHIYLPGTHEMSLEGSKVDLGVLMTELRDTMPAVWDKIGGELEEPVTRPRTSKSVRKPARTPLLRRKDMPGLSTERLPPITLCMTAWFMSCYIGTLPIETTLRVWDVFFYEGSKTLFRVALAIFKLGESEIKAVSDPMEMFGVVQTMPRRMLDANQVMEASFKWRNGFNHLSQDVIEERRQERREKVRQDLQRTRGKSITSNNKAATLEADPHQKGHLFGRKK